MKRPVSLLKWMVLLMLLMGSSLAGQSQTPDTTAHTLNDQLVAQLEAITEALDANVDFSDLLDAYYFFAENKININGPEVNELQAIYLITAFQLERLREYQRRFGQMLSIYELSLVEGFDAQTVSLLLPLLTVQQTSRSQQLNWRNVLKWGRNQVLFRTERVLETREGYKHISDSAWLAKPNSRYLGGPERVYARYTFNYRNRIRAGITMDKDPGEVFFAGQLNDSIRQLAGSRLRSGFDFYSAHAFVRDIGPLKALAIGDYHLAFGQGLTMWTGLAFGKSADPNGVMKFGQGVRANTSVNEALFMRGVAATFGWKQFELTGFYSHRDLDATQVSVVDSLSGEDFFVSSIQETGLHRTINELLKKGNVSQTVFGGRAAYRSTKLEMGYTLHHTVLGAPLNPRIYPYNKFRFAGKEISNQGFDFRLVYPHAVYFGELSHSSNGALAGIAGVSMQPAGFVSVTIAYRNYQKEYHNLFGNGFSEGSITNNERGIFMGVTAGLAPGWKLSAFADHFSFPWLRYLTNAPSQGSDYSVQIDRRVNRRTDWYVRFRTKTKMTNDRDPWNTINYITNYSRSSFRFHINNNLGRSFFIKNRAEYILFEQQGKGRSEGFIIYQDVLYRPANKPYDLTFRYAIFDTDNYDSRVFMYENDVLYAFSIPSFYDRGSRMYLMMRIKVNKSLDIWARIAQTWYSNRSTIGTGLELIDGNQRTDVKFQLRWKF